ncbi:hypothetical protein LCGC14_1000780 [marine sediment metagenome]|uniref:Radical SAM core domain-containing protein n=1 Tax=marine sediment metagenome TaxID=412755 RepID=A0A0F9NPM1_9ZZZZ|nr:radical SAM protein [Actinomycetota bacterium]
MNKEKELLDPLPDNPSRIPRSVNIQVHNSCNSKCVMCAYKDTYKKESYNKMSMQLFTKIVDEFSSQGINRFCPSLQCEPFHHPEIFEMIKYLKDKDAVCGITSNGILLNRKITDSIFESGLDILTISLNAVTEDTFKYVYGQSGLDSLIKNLTYLVENKPDHLRMAFSSMLIKQNYDELTSKNHEIFRVLEKNNIRSGMGPIGNHCGGLSNYSEIVVKPEGQSSTEKMYCHDIFEAIYILSSGEVIGCCSDFRKKYILGNIKDQSFAEIWNSDINQQRRHDMMHGNLYDFEPCKDCSQAWNVMKNRGVNRPNSLAIG